MEHRPTIAAIAAMNKDLKDIKSSQLFRYEFEDSHAEVNIDDGGVNFNVKIYEYATVEQLKKTIEVLEIGLNYIKSV